MAKRPHYGDSGTTRDFAGQTIDKNSCLTNALGDIDELIAYLGLVRYIVKNESLFIKKIQLQLQAISSTIANFPNPELHLTIDDLDKKIDQIDSNFQYNTKFYIPGDKEIPTFINIARTVCRRAERSVVGQKPEDKKIIAFMNRLSTYLFALQIYFDKQ